MASEFEVISRSEKLTRIFLGFYASLIYVFLFVPIVLLVLFSFNANRYGTFPITKWTLSWYRLALNDYEVQAAVATTLKVGAAVAIVCTAVGTAAAFPLVRTLRRFQDTVRISFLLPIMIPALLIGISLLSFLTGVLHMQLSPTTAVIGQCVDITPFVLLVVSARLQGLDPSLEKAASDLGANAFRRFVLVVLPQLLPAIAAGALLAITLSIDEFIITFLLIGNQNTLPIYIYTQVRYGITPEINAVASLLLLATFLLLSSGFWLPRAVRAVRRRSRAEAVL
jgi:spermidine/putrescine transport system permease protein